MSSWSSNAVNPTVTPLRFFPYQHTKTPSDGQTENVYVSILNAYAKSNLTPAQEAAFLSAPPPYVAVGNKTNKDWLQAFLA